MNHVKIIIKKPVFRIGFTSYVLCASMYMGKLCNDTYDDHVNQYKENENDYLNRYRSSEINKERDAGKFGITYKFAENSLSSIIWTLSIASDISLYLKKPNDDKE